MVGGGGARESGRRSWCEYKREARRSPSRSRDGKKGGSGGPAWCAGEEGQKGRERGVAQSCHAEEKGGGGPVPQGRSRSGGVRAGDRQSERELLPGGPQPQCRVARRG
jgi:hypothetical protein